jgi:seryl-tRNA synthetase
MSKIFDLTNKQSELAARLLWADEPEEIEALSAEIDALQGSAEDIIKWLSNIYVEATATASARKERAQALAKQAKTAENAAARLKEKILSTMLAFDIKKIETPLINFRTDAGRESIFINPDVDYSTWPDFLIKTKTITEPDKAEAKKFILDGHELPGAFIVKKPFLVGK